MRKNHSGKKSSIRNPFVILLALLMLFVLPVSASESADAELPSVDGSIIIENPGQDGEGEPFLPSADQMEQVEEERLGSIEVRLTEGKEGTTISGITFYCIPVADISGGEYELLEQYDQLGVDFREIENSNQLEAAASKLAESASEGLSATTDDQGCAVFEGLEVGVYLIKAEDNEAYDMIAPTLLAIPTWNEEAGEMSYEILVEPKHEPRPDVPENEAPQTNLEDRTLFYIGAAGVCVLLAIVLVIADRKKKGA